MTDFNFLLIMIKVLLGLLASSALSKGMFINNKTENFTPPPPGSNDRPIPSEYRVNGNYPPQRDHYWRHHDDNMSDVDNPQIRGFRMHDEMPNGMPFPTENYSMPSNDYPLPPNGMTNPQGPRMHDMQYLTYCNMILDDPVPPTADQVPWFCTCILCKEARSAPKGERGDRGLPGPPGSTGSRGISGPRGPPGFIGLQGLKGQKGDQGMKGNNGQMGPMGNIGARGFKGEKGDYGVGGNPGTQGPPGPPGNCPTTCASVSGPPGEAGLPGAVGPRGIPGKPGDPGLKGEKGDLGEMGKPGVNGQKGDQGEQGMCNCKDGVKGANGTSGTPGPKGEKGNDGSQGLQGASGPKGEKGDLGLTGLPGPCSITIQSGFSARLTNSKPVPNMPVPFSNVIYNIQSHYNPIIGNYIAPVNGTYIFSYNLCVLNEELRVGLYHNFLPIVRSTGSVNLTMVSQEVVLHLNFGDLVWVQVKDASSNGMCVNGERSSTFSGFLLYPDRCDMPLSRDFPEPITGTYSWGEL